MRYRQRCGEFIVARGEREQHLVPEKGAPGGILGRRHLGKFGEKRSGFSLDAASDVGFAGALIPTGENGFSGESGVINAPRRGGDGGLRCPYVLIRCDEIMLFRGRLAVLEGFAVVLGFEIIAQYSHVRGDFEAAFQRSVLGIDVLVERGWRPRRAEGGGWRHNGRRGKKGSKNQAHTRRTCVAWKGKVQIGNPTLPARPTHSSKINGWVPRSTLCSSEHGAQQARVRFVSDGHFDIYR
jgi:hypothetical protein